MPKAKKSLDLAIALTLSEEDWAELYYAVVDKQMRVCDTETLDGLTHGLSGEEAADWRDSLDRVVKEVTERLDKNGVKY